MVVSPFRVAAVLCVSLVLSGTSVKGESPDSCPSWRPCGGGKTRGGNKWIPQSRTGIDFRPICLAHDRCYGAANKTREQCDKDFLNALRSACDNSIRPHACKRRAKVMYLAVRWFGADHYGVVKDE
jgi:hypothetical protein